MKISQDNILIMWKFLISSTVRGVLVFGGLVDGELMIKTRNYSSLGLSVSEAGQMGWAEPSTGIYCRRIRARDKPMGNIYHCIQHTRILQWESLCGYNQWWLGCPFHQKSIPAKILGVNYRIVNCLGSMPSRFSFRTISREVGYVNLDSI